MTRMFLPVVAALLAAACTSPTRTQPPAPVYEKGQRTTGESGSSAAVETTGISGPEISLGAPGSEAAGVPQPELATPPATPLPGSAAQSTATTAGPVAVASATSVATIAPKSARPMGSAGQALVAQAEAKSAAGDLTGAASYLERAVRVEPQHPLPWNRLARVRLAQGSHGLAAQLAQKSNALVGDDRVLKRDNWMIVSESRRGEGDLAGAEEARRRADELR